MKHFETITYFTDDYETIHLFFSTSRKNTKRLIWEWIDKTANTPEMIRAERKLHKKYERLNAMAKFKAEKEVARVKKEWDDYFNATQEGKVEWSWEVYQQKGKEKDDAEKALDRLQYYSMPAITREIARYFWTSEDSVKYGSEYYQYYCPLLNRQQVYDRLIKRVRKIKVDVLSDYRYTNGD